MRLFSFTLALALLLASASSMAQQGDSAAVAAGKKIVQEIVGGQFDQVESQYDSAMAAALPSGRLAAVWAALLNQEGSFDSIVSATSSEFQNYDVVVVVCGFEKGMIEAQISLDSGNRIAGIFFRPHVNLPPWTAPGYVNVDAFTEQPLELQDGNYVMPGTLTMPRGHGRFPVVVLVHGSGPQDEDETIGADKPFKDLAWGLASHGIAVFRYMKRTQRYGTQSSADPARFTVEQETILDARTAVTQLELQPGMNTRRIFVLGHSLGGYLAPRIATKDSEIAGIVMMAANTEPLEQLLLEQVRNAVSASGASDPDAQKQLAAVEDAVKKIESPDLKLGDNVTLLGGSIPASYWLDLRGYQPVAAARELKMPILILQGGRDSQIPTATNFEQWKAGLAGRENVSFKLYPDLNHAFIAGTGPSTAAEYNQAGHVDGAVVADIAAWVAADGKPRK